MKIENTVIPTRLLGRALLGGAMWLSVLPQTFAANPMDPATHAAHVAAGTMPPDAPTPADPTKSDPMLSQQLSELQAKVAQLEAALAKNAPSMTTVPGASPTMGMDKMKSGRPMASMAPAGNTTAMSAGAMPASAMPGMAMPVTAAPPAAPMSMMGMMQQMMGMMDKMMSMPGGSMPAAAPMAPMPPGGMATMPMDKMEMAGMMGMAPMTGGASGAMPQSALPGFPGASHLYHIGATDFFLDHPQHIALSTEQTAALNKAKEQALLAKSTADRAIEQAEQELWTLTASDQPDAAKIEAKVRQTEKLTGDSRLAFVRAVGDASKILTDEQRKILTGFAPPTAGMAAPAPAMAPMKGM